MATILTHAALPLLAGRIWRPRGVSSRRLALVSVVLAVLPDADYLGLLFDIRPEDLLGHRGLSHSLLTALILATAAGVLFFNRPKPDAKLAGEVATFLGFAALSHGLLDAMTRGDLGVALFAPVDGARLFLPWRPLHSIPLGINESFGKWGALVFLGEVLVVLAPLALVGSAVEARRAGRKFRSVAIGTAAWALACFLTFLAAPSLFARASTPALSAADTAGIPTAGLPDGALVTRFDALRGLNLLDRRLTPTRVPWSSTFFPAWYGAEAGRWEDSKLTLVWRTLFGFHGPFAPLSPAEKYDAAVGDAAWTATARALEHGHNGHPRFWFGLCNGVAVAALNFDEPHRTVDAVAPNGTAVRFHPQDIKALLAASNYWASEFSEVGDRCDEVRLDSGARCSMNAGSLVLALANRLGLAGTSFLVDVHPTPQNQYYPVAAATLTVTRAPYPLDGNAVSKALAGKVTSLTDVEVKLGLSSTTLGFAPGNQPGADASHFQRVGLREVPFTWNATLALGPDTEILGGRWNGDPPVGPDSIAFLSGGPLLTDGGMVDFNPGLRWSVVEALAKASVDENAAAPRVDVGALLDGGTRSP